MAISVKLHLIFTISFLFFFRGKDIQIETIVASVHEISERTSISIHIELQQNKRILSRNAAFAKFFFSNQVEHMNAQIVLVKGKRTEQSNAKQQTDF